MRYLLHLVGIDDRYGTCKVGFLLCTVAYYYDLVEHSLVCTELNALYYRASADCYFLVLIAYIAHHEDGIGWGCDLEITVNVGDCAGIGVLNLDSCTDKRFTILVNYLSLDCYSLGSLGYCCHQWGRTYTESTSNETETQHHRE